MPHAIDIAAARRLIYLRIWGPTGHGGIEAVRRDLSLHPQVDPAFDVLVDLLDADLTELSVAHLQDLAASSILRPTARRALVANTETVFGVSRTYQALHDLGNAGGEVAVFRTLADGLAWLGASDFMPSATSALSSVRS
jgi:hypothetical protein